MTGQKINDVTISRAIIETYHKNLLSDTELDAAIVAVFERKLSPGGGMWGGGIGYNIIVVQEEGRQILDEFGIGYEEYAPGHYTANSVETTAALIYSACKAGASVYNLLSVEDVMISNQKISGVVIIWSAIEIAELHVDPISISARFVLEATGHPLEVIKKVVKKCDLKLNTPSGDIEGERSMNAELGEEAILENTLEVAPGLFVAGMAANAVMGSFRMGPIFGGMLLSGRKAAEEIDKRLSGGA